MLVGQRRSTPTALQRDRQRDVAAGDRRAARAAVGGEHVAVDPHRPLAELLEVDRLAQRAADEPLDLDRAPVGPALGGVALLALPGARGEHPVLGGDPAGAAALHPARDRVLDGGGADHARPALRDERAAGRRRHEADLEGVGRSCAGARSYGAGQAGISSRGSTRSTGAERQLQEAGAERAERLGVARAQEAVVALGRRAGSTGRGTTSACSTWRASASPEVTICTPRPRKRWSIGRTSG